MTLTTDAVAAELSRIQNPETGQDLMASGAVQALNVEGGTVRFVLEAKDGAAMEPVRVAAVAAVEKLPGVEKVLAVTTQHAEPKSPPDLKPARPKPEGPVRIEGIDRILAIGSGKGGVGKSTVSGNLAVALAAEGGRVGLLDADVYGPSQPRILGLSGPPGSPDGKTMVPLKGHGVSAMSIGLMVDEGEALIWRGPMVIGALQQMLTKVNWGQLDVLIVDLPPGTGDVQLTLSQKFVVDGAIVVSTPQDLALLDARKAVDMFRKVSTPVVGMIENMSTHVCSNCGQVEHIFGHGGARADAERLGIPFLGEIPLDISIREGADRGVPIVVSDPDSAQAGAFRSIARQLIE